MYVYTISCEAVSWANEEGYHLQETPYLVKVLRIGDCWIINLNPYH